MPDSRIRIGNGGRELQKTMPFVALGALLVGAVVPDSLGESPSLELGDLVLLLMPKSGERVDWDYRADSAITWQIPGFTEQREQRRAMAWDSKRDPNSYMDPQNLFNARLDAYRKEYPDWFKGEEEPADPHTVPLTTEVFNTVLEGFQNQLSASSDLTRTTYLAVLKILTRTAWLGWGVAALLAIVLLIRR